MSPVMLVLLSLAGQTANAQAGIQAGTHGHYLVLTCKPHTPAPFAAVDIVYGPAQAVGGRPYIWWWIEAREKDGPDTPPLFRLTALTSRDPLVPSDEPLLFERYIVTLPAAREVLEYRNVHTGGAFLPRWRDFEKHFIPNRARGSRVQEGVPQTCTYLGHVLTLKRVGHNVPWEAPEKAKRLELDPELLVGTSRSFKDSEGHRLPQQPERQNYTYIPFVEADYPVMMDAGINLFIVSGEQEPFVRDEPVFYLRPPDKEPHLRYPADLYRSNYLGSQMFMDEPSIIMVGDELIHKTLRYFSDAGAVIEKRVRQGYDSAAGHGAFSVERSFAKLGANFGDMRLEQWDYPSWETLYETAYYQMAGGLQGIVHEGRYQRASFDEAVAKWTDKRRKHTAEELLKYHYAFLRGGTRPFGKHWGTAIYGQCDPKISPTALTLAYDMGARYLWFWTSDHDHHMPWPEQLQLAKILRQHATEHPRPSIFGPQPVRDLAIVLPYGYFLSLENLWWVRELDPEGQNEASARYRRLMRRAFQTIHEAFDRGEDFDITVDDGREIAGYRRIVRLSDAP